MGFITHNLVSKQNVLKEKIFDKQLSVALIKSIFLIFIITAKILRKSRIKWNRTIEIRLVISVFLTSKVCTKFELQEIKELNQADSC